MPTIRERWELAVKSIQENVSKENERLFTDEDEYSEKVYKLFKRMFKLLPDFDVIVSSNGGFCVTFKDRSIGELLYRKSVYGPEFSISQKKLYFKKIGGNNITSREITFKDMVEQTFDIDRDDRNIIKFEAEALRYS